MPEAPLDVLAQQIVAAVAAESLASRTLFARVRSAAPYRGLEHESFLAVVRALAEPLPAEVKGVSPRILWDRVNDRLHPRRGSRLLALTSGGTIADAGLFDVYLADTDVKLGTLDEEFVSERLPGSVFLLGSRPWKLIKTTPDRVLVEDASGHVADGAVLEGRAPVAHVGPGVAVGRLRREAGERLEAPDFLAWAQARCGLDERAATSLRAWLVKGRDLLGGLPDDGRIIVESLSDELGGRHLVIHSVYGMRVNGAWGIALKEALRSRFGIVAETSHTDDAILFSFAPGQSPPAPERLPALVAADDVEALVVRGLIGSPLFTTRFRHCAVRALAIARMMRGQRTPAWLQRLKADALLEAVGGRPDFPLVAETLRECCRDALDVPRLSRPAAADRGSERCRRRCPGRGDAVAVHLPAAAGLGLGVSRRWPRRRAAHRRHPDGQGVAAPRGRWSPPSWRRWSPSCSGRSRAGGRATPTRSRRCSRRSAISTTPSWPSAWPAIPRRCSTRSGPSAGSEGWNSPAAGGSGFPPPMPRSTPGWQPPPASSAWRCACSARGAR